MEENSYKTTSLREADKDNNQENEIFRYKDLFDSAEEDMTPPIDIQLAEVCKKIWNNAILKERHQEKFAHLK